VVVQAVLVALLTLIFSVFGENGFRIASGEGARCFRRLIGAAGDLLRVRLTGNSL
jgi:hypothetical protein